METYFDAHCLEADSKEVPELEPYIRFRRNASGCKPCFALIEYANGLNLPDEVLQDPIVCKLQEIANDIISWSNVGFFHHRIGRVTECMDLTGHRVLRHGTGTRGDPEHGRDPYGAPRNGSSGSRGPRRGKMRSSYQTLRRK